jgi:hypothetical protein
VAHSCIRVTGKVDTVRAEPDGDRHIRLRLDPGQGNDKERGDLVLEWVCIDIGSQVDSIGSCKSDPDPLKELPREGLRIWVEGRYVHNLDHDWAELHPVYRWGRIEPFGQ